MASYLTVAKDTARLKYPFTETTLTVNVFSSDSLATPSTISGIWRVGSNSTENSLTLTPGATGIYTAAIAPEESGFVHYQIKTTGPALSIEGSYLIEPSHFDETGTKDYQ